MCETNLMKVHSSQQVRDIHECVECPDEYSDPMRCQLLINPGKIMVRD